MAIRPIILCGGSGSRLWPLSRGSYPKHLLPLIGDKTLLQQTAERLAALEAEPLAVVTNAEHAFLVGRQLEEVDILPDWLIVEPIARGTAPAVALAALEIADDDPDAILLIAPSDHLILKTDAFADAVANASKLADQGYIATIGVTPTAPETGYGYIQRGDSLFSGGYVVDRFVEKPDRDRAAALIEGGRCTWNSGIFIARASVMLDEMAQHAPAMLDAVRASMAGAKRDGAVVSPAVEALQDCPSDSLDYAVMEATDRAAVVPADLGWSDLGSWSALWQVSEDQDEHGNVLVGDVTAVDTHDCYVRADEGLVAVVGVENLVVVMTGDAVVVAARERSEEIKTVVEHLKDKGRREATTSPVLLQPWGSYVVLEDGPSVRVRRLTILPGGTVTEQETAGRLDWTVIAGTGELTMVGETTSLRPGKGPLGCKAESWEIRNTGTAELQIVEVSQTDRPEPAGSRSTQ